MFDRLDRRFAATLSGDELGRMPSELVRALVDRRVLADAGGVSTVPRCVCDERDQDCVVDVSTSSGTTLGRCRVYGVRVTVAPEQTRRYRFDVDVWARWLRLKNRLAGSGPTMGDGAMFVGSGAIGGRDFGLLVVSPVCAQSSDVVVPDGSRQDGRVLVALLLGDPLGGPEIGPTLLRSDLGPDMGTISPSSLERAVLGASVRVVRSAVTYVMFSREFPSGRRIDDVEYERVASPDVRDTFDLFIDVPACAVWRRGRRHREVLDADGRSKKKILGPTSVGLLADYVKRPERPMKPKETPTYRTSSIAERSAAAQLAEVRRSVRGRDFLRPGARSNSHSALPYIFTPRGLSWCVLDRPAE